MPLKLQSGDVLLAIDVQNDFVGGALAVPGAKAILPRVHAYIGEFEHRGLPVIATRDWHPTNHCSFRSRGGPWPAHCVQGLLGAQFAEGSGISARARVVSKGSDPDREAYSAFEATRLDAMLRDLRAHRLFVCGLATDYCVRATVLDARRRGFEVLVLVDAIAAVDAREGDGRAAIEEMRSAGAVAISPAELDLAATAGG